MKITFLVSYKVLGFRLWLKKLNGLKKRRIIRLIKNEKNVRELSSRVAFTTDGTTAPKSMFWAPPVCPDLSRRHDWPVKKAVVDLPIRLKGDLKRTSGNSLSPFGAQNKDLGAAASQTLLDVGWSG